MEREGEKQRELQTEREKKVKIERTPVSLERGDTREKESEEIGFFFLLLSQERLKRGKSEKVRGCKSERERRKTRKIKREEREKRRKGVEE